MAKNSLIDTLDSLKRPSANNTQQTQTQQAQPQAQRSWSSNPLLTGVTDSGRRANRTYNILSQALSFKQVSPQQLYAKGEQTHQERLARQEEYDRQLKEQQKAIHDFGKPNLFSSDEDRATFKKLTEDYEKTKAEKKAFDREMRKGIDWEGRDELIDEYKKLDRAGYLNPKMAARKEEIRKELEMKDAVAGNGVRDYSFGDRTSSIVGSFAKGIGSKAAELGGEIAEGGRGGYSLMGVSVNGDYLPEEVKAEADRRREEHIAWMYDTADSLGESATADLARAREGLNAVGRTLVDVSSNMLEMAFDAGVAAATGGSSLAVMFARVLADSMREARNDGVDGVRRLGYGVTKGVIEVATEKMFDGVLGVYGKGIASEEFIETIINRLAHSDAGKTALRVLSSGTGEAIEELVSGALDPFANLVKTGKLEADSKAAEETAYSCLVGFIIGFLGGGGNVVRGGNAAANAQTNALNATYEQMGGRPSFGQELSDRALISPDAYIGAHDPNAERLRTIQNALLNPVSSRANRSSRSNRSDTTTTSAAGEGNRTSLSPEERYVKNVLADESMSDNEKAMRILASGYYAEAFENMSGVELDGTETENELAIREWLQNRAGAQEASGDTETPPSAQESAEAPSRELNNASEEKVAESRTPISFENYEGGQYLLTDDGRYTTEAEEAAKQARWENAPLYQGGRSGAESNSRAYNDAIDSAIEDIRDDFRNVSQIAEGKGTYANLTPRERADLLNFLSTELDPESGYTAPYLPDGGEWYVSGGVVVRAEEGIRGSWHAQNERATATQSFVRDEDNDYGYTQRKRAPSSAEDEAYYSEHEESRAELPMQTQLEKDVAEANEPRASDVRTLTAEQAKNEDRKREQSRKGGKHLRKDDTSYYKWLAQRFGISEREAKAREAENERQKKATRLKDAKAKGYIVHRLLGEPNTRITNPKYVELQKNPAALREFVDGKGQWAEWSARARFDMLERLFPEANWGLEHTAPGWETSSENGINYPGGRTTATPDVITLLKTSKQQDASDWPASYKTEAIHDIDEIASKSNIERANRNNPLLHRGSRNGKIDASRQKGATTNGERSNRIQNGRAAEEVRSMGSGSGRGASAERGHDIGEQPDSYPSVSPATEKRIQSYYGDEAKAVDPRTTEDHDVLHTAAFSYYGAKTNLVDAPAGSTATNGTTTLASDGTIRVELRRNHPAGKVGRYCAAAHEGTHVGFLSKFKGKAYEKAADVYNDFLKFLSPELSEFAESVKSGVAEFVPEAREAFEFFAYVAGGDLRVEADNYTMADALQKQVRKFLIDSGLVRKGQYYGVSSVSAYNTAMSKAAGAASSKRAALTSETSQSSDVGDILSSIEEEKRRKGIMRDYMLKRNALNSKAKMLNSDRAEISSLKKTPAREKKISEIDKQLDEIDSRLNELEAELEKALDGHPESIAFLKKRGAAKQEATKAETPSENPLVSATTKAKRKTEPKLSKKAARELAREAYEADFFKGERAREESQGVDVIAREEDYRKPKTKAEYRAKLQETEQKLEQAHDELNQALTEEGEKRRERYEKRKAEDEASGPSDYTDEGPYEDLYEGIEEDGESDKVWAAVREIDVLEEQRNKYRLEIEALDRQREIPNMSREALEKKLESLDQQLLENSILSEDFANTQGYSSPGYDFEEESLNRAYADYAAALELVKGYEESLSEKGSKPKPKPKSENPLVNAAEKAEQKAAPKPEAAKKEPVPQPKEQAPQSSSEYAAQQRAKGKDGRSNVDMAKREKANEEEAYRQQRYADTHGIDNSAGWARQERARRESQREAEETLETAENHFAAAQAYGEEVHRNIIKTANRVANMVFLPDPSGKPIRNRNARHMQPLIDAVVGLADGSLTLNDFINTYHEFGEAENKDTVGYFYDPAVDARLRRLKEFPMDGEGQYSTEARSILKETMDALEHRTQRLLNKRADASKAVTEIKSTNTGLDGSTPALFKGFILKQLRPDTFFHAITGFAKNTSNVAYQLAGKAEKSTQRKINISTAAENYFRGAMDNVKAYRGFSTGKTKVNTVIPGLDRSMSMNEALGLLRTLETDGAKDHIIKCAEREVDDDGYGTVFSHSEKDLYGGDQENGFRNPLRASLLSDEAIKTLRDAWGVDPKQRGRAIAQARAKARLELDALAKSLRAEVEADAVASKFDKAITRAMRMLGKEIDSTYSAMYGVNAAKQGKNYWPLSVASTGNDAELMADIRTGLKNAKFIQERVGPTGSLRIMTATDVMAHYIDAASDFAAFAELSDDLELMSKTYRGDVSFKAQLEKSFGREAGKWLDRYVDTLNGKRGDTSRWASKIRSNLAQSSLLLNGGVALKQSPSYFDMVGAGIDFDIAMQAWRPFRSAKSWSNNPLVNAIATRSSMLEARKRGYADVEIGEFTKDARDLSKKLIDRIPAALTNWITKTDFRTVSNVLLACQMQVEKNGGVEVGSAKYYDRIARLFEDVVLKTQPIYTAQFRAEYQRSDNELIRSLSMFRSQQTQNFNQIINAVGEYSQIKKGGDPESIRKAEQNMHRVFAGQITGGVLFGIMSGVARGLLRKDDDFKDKDGNITAGSVLKRLGLNTAESIAGTVWFGDVAAKALVDVVSNAVTGGKGTKEFYSVNDNVISGFNSFITNLISFASKPSAKKGWNIAFSLSQLTGLPIRNCYNMVNALVEDFQSVDERFNFTVDDSSENAPAEPDKNAASTALANAATATKPSSTSSEKKEDTDLDKQIRIAKKAASEYDTSRDHAAMDKILAAKLGDDDTDNYVDKYMSKPYREVYFALRDVGFEPKEIYNRYKDIDTENGGNGNISQKEMLAYYKAHPESSALIAAIYNSKGYTKYPTWDEYIKHKK